MTGILNGSIYNNANHIYGIIIMDNPVGAAPCGRPLSNDEILNNRGQA